MWSGCVILELKVEGALPGERAGTLLGGGLEPR